MNATRSTCKNFCSLGFSSLLFVLLAACGSEQASEPVTESAPAVEQQALMTPRPPSPEERAERERNKAIVASYMEVSDDPAAQQEFLAADYQLIRGEFHNLSYNAGGSELEDLSDDIHVAIPDREVEIVELLGEGSTVFVQYKIRGIHQGNLYGIPATGKSIDIDSVAFFELADGRIQDGWFFAEEVLLLNQIGMVMPTRADGKIIVPPTNAAARSGDDFLAEALADPIDSQEYRNKLKVNAYKAPNSPDDMYPIKENGRPYNTWTRNGFLLFSGHGKEPSKTEFPFGRALPDRVDLISSLVADGDKVVIRFLLTATNTASMYGMPATNDRVGVWEVGIQTFNGDDWDTGWWFGDDHGMLSQLGGSPEYFAVDESAE